MIYSPVAYIPVRITQGYKPAGNPNHNAVDIGNAENAPIFCIESGYVVRNSWQDGTDHYGNHYFVIKGIDTKHTFIYVHTRPIKTNVNGTILQAGTIVGFTSPPYEGNSKGCHLHLRIMAENNEDSINPLDFFTEHSIKWRLK
jgi:murein DD-endopeptidase MepM/ murein hydrolase activator NlpD